MIWLGANYKETHMKSLLFILALIPVMAQAQLANPAVTQANIQSTICIHGYTATIRPTKYYTGKVKRQMLRAQGIPLSKVGRYELDHIIPLEVGGHPSDPRNLQLQLWVGPRNAHMKDRLEGQYHRAVCTGKSMLLAAQDYFTSTWVIKP